MDFVETLKSVGGVKPCPVCGVPSAIVCETLCNTCHGTGQVLDLAPLLAKPDLMEECAKELLLKYAEIHNHSKTDKTDFGPAGIPRDKLIIVGPQRAHSLVYEVARQLGGTAVVVIEEDADQQSVDWNKPRDKDYRLSLPVPPDATVLFVTDRWDVKEMSPIYMTVINEKTKFTMLPYILSLMSDTEYFDSLKIISLYQDK